MATKLTFFIYCISIKLIRITLLISKKVLMLCSFIFSINVTSIASERAIRSDSGIPGNVSSNQLRIIFFSDSLASILTLGSLKLSRPRQTSLKLGCVEKILCEDGLNKQSRIHRQNEHIRHLHGSHRIDHAFSEKRRHFLKDKAYCLSTISFRAKSSGQECQGRYHGCNHVPVTA